MIRFIQWFIKPLGYHVISEDDLCFMERELSRLYEMEVNLLMVDLFEGEHFQQPSYEGNVVHVNFKV